MTDIPNQPLTRKALREQAEAIARQKAQAEQKEVEETVKQVELDEDGNPIFKVPTALTGAIPTTNMVIDTPPDITTGGTVFTEAGEIVTTGSIDVSDLITVTSEIDVIQIDNADEDLDKDAQKNYIPGIPPIRVSGVLAKTANQPGLPGGAHRGLNPVVSILLASLTGLLIAGGTFLYIITHN